MRAPTTEQLHELLYRIITRIMKWLSRQAYLIEEEGMRYLGEIEEDRALTPLQAASCTYRIALGPSAGQKVLSLRTLGAVVVVQIEALRRMHRSPSMEWCRALACTSAAGRFCQECAAGARKGIVSASTD